MPPFTCFFSYLGEPKRGKLSFSYRSKRNKSETATTHLCYTPVGHTGPSSAGVQGCNGGSDLPPGKQHSGPNKARTVSSWSGRNPPDKHPDIDPGRGTLAPQTYLHTEIKKRKSTCSFNAHGQIFFKIVFLELGFRCFSVNGSVGLFGSCKLITLNSHTSCVRVCVRKKEGKREGQRQR